MHHPWRLLRSLTDWTLHWQRSSLVDGVTHFPSKTITLDPRQLQVERRCTIAHELVHIARGPVPADPRLAEREEAAVEQETARRLITLDDLLDALRWSDDPHEVADECWVTTDVLLNRVEHLHPSERAWLHSQLDRD